MDTIYTLNARGHILLEVMQTYFNLDSNRMYSEIQGIFKQTIKILESKNIQYKDLRNCLVPGKEKNKKEVILVFDSIQIDKAWYGGEVFNKIFPLLDRNTKHSFLCGDCVDNKNLFQEKLHYELLSRIEFKHQTKYEHSSQYYFIYINNISSSAIETINKGLENYHPYTGYIDITYSSFLKIYTSTILCNDFIKCGDTIICPHEDDRDNSENHNLKGYGFEKNGYQCISIQDSLFNMFLSYKIERPVFNGFEKDTHFSLNALTKDVTPIEELSIEITEDRLKYLHREKQGQMKKSGLVEFSKNELEKLIRDKLKQNYLYQMTYKQEYEVLKFNVMIEKHTVEETPIKLLVCLKYLPAKKKLEVISMY